ncbi:hypothetical protein ABIB00_007889 [Bradyrhizobium sp. LB14.3]
MPAGGLSNFLLSVSIIAGDTRRHLPIDSGCVCLGSFGELNYKPQLAKR